MPEGVSDTVIWEYARKHEYTILTADDDFSAILKRRGYPPKIVWLQRCDYPTRVAEDLVRRDAVRIVEFDNRKRGLLVL